MTSGETPDVGLYFRPIFMRNSHVIPQVARRSAVYGARHGYGPGSVIGLAFRTAFMGEVGYPGRRAETAACGPRRDRDRRPACAGGGHLLAAHARPRGSLAAAGAWVGSRWRQSSPAPHHARARPS
jgi:hypothetical protein